MSEIHPKDTGLAFPRYIKTGKAPKVNNEPESVLQSQVEGYLDVKGISYIHIPDAMYKFLYSGYLADALKKNFKLYGWLKGIQKVVSNSFLGLPDLLIFKAGKLLAIELKTSKGRTSKSQDKWIKKLNAKVCRSFEEAKEVIDEWEKPKK